MLFRSKLLFVLTFLFCCMTVEVFSKPYTPVPAHSSEKTLWGSTQKKEVPAEKPSDFSLKTEELSDRTEAVIPAWLEYALPAPEVPEESPMIAIVIDDLGLNEELTEEVLSLPAPITAAFLPYAGNLSRQTAIAVQNGHELLLHTPMEPLNPRRNAGSNALKTDGSPEEINDNLEKMLNAFDGYVGINNHMGSKFTADQKAVFAVMTVLKKRGLLFLDSMTSSESVAWKEAGKHHVPYAVRDVFLDNSQEEDDIRKQLILLERRARKHHVAVAIGHPHHTTIETLKKWIPQAKKKGFVFVPISLVALIGQETF